MAATPTTFRRVSSNAYANRPAPKAAARDYEQALVVAAFGAQVLALLAFAGLEALASPQAAMLLPGLAGATLVAWRPRGWAFAAAAVLLAVLPLLVLLGFGALAELGNPLLGGSWASAVLLVLALLLALPAAVAGFRRARASVRPAEPGWRFGLTLLAGCFLLGAIAAGGLAAQEAAQRGAAGSYDVAPDAAAHVVAQSFAYPAKVPLRAGALTEVTVENRDPAFHTFTYTIGGKTYSHDVPGSGSAKFLMRLDQPGDVRYWCAPHAPGMAGVLVVA